MGISYNVAIDMWSLGCILVEMHTGQPLFAGKNEYDQIGKICEVCGIPSPELLEEAPKKTTYFTEDGYGNYILRPPKDKTRVCLRDILDFFFVVLFCLDFFIFIFYFV